jgi:hypothetical protein
MGRQDRPGHAPVTIDRDKARRALSRDSHGVVASAAQSGAGTCPWPGHTITHGGP